MSQKKLKKERVMAKVVDKQSSYDPGEFEGIIKILRSNWIFLLGVCVMTILLYLNSLHGHFVSDDYASITQNPTVTNFGLMFSGLNMVSIITYLGAVLFGVTNPFMWHVLSLFLYIVFLIVSFIFLDIVFKKRIAIITTLLFATHPIHVEAISWISGKPYLLGPIFILLSLIYFVLYLRSRNKRYLWLLVLGILLSLSADKVRTPSLLFLILVYVLAFDRWVFKKVNFLKVLGIVISAGILFTILLWPMIVNRVTSVNSGYNQSDSIFYNPFFQYPTAIAKYLQLLFIPIDLTLYHTMYIFPVWLNWFIFLVFIISLIYFYFKNPKLFFSLAFIFAATAPSMAPVKVSWLVAERYVFFGSLGFCVFIALLLEKLYSKQLIVGTVVLSLIVTLFCYRTYIRNIDWQTNHNLWVNTCQVSPNSHNAWNNIGDDYDKLKDYPDAIKGFTQSTVVKPDYADAYHNRANIFFKMGRLDLARDSYMMALNYSPGLYHSYLSLIQIDLMEKNAPLVVEHVKKLLDLQPNNPQSWYVAAVVSAQMGNKQQAIELVQKALSIDPNYSLASNLLQQLSIAK